MHIILSFVLTVILCLGVLTGCDSIKSIPTSQPPALEPTQPRQPSATPPPSPAPSAVPAIEATKPNELPLEPSPIAFRTEDGRTIKGVYYPPKNESKLITVLMHQFTGDYTQWKDIAPRLQNGGLAVSSSYNGGFGKLASMVNPHAHPDAIDAAAVSDALSSGVLAFTFSGCENKGTKFQPELWLKDAYAALQFAGQKTEQNNARIIVMGSSTGADAAIDACARYFNEASKKCDAVVAVSPGESLRNEYIPAATTLINHGALVACISGADDPKSGKTCPSVRGANYETIVIPGKLHGLQLFDDSIERSPMTVWQEIAQRLVESAP